MLGQLDTFVAFVVVILGISLLITVLNHIVTALLGLRGTNLRWGIEMLLTQVDPRLAPHAKRISEEILQHPLISDSTMSTTHSWPLIGKRLGRWRLASAITVGELLHILRKFAESAPAGQTDSWRATLVDTLARHDRQGAERLQAANDALNKLTPETAKRLDELAPHVAIRLRQAVGDLELWFDSIMDRVSQRYAARVRVFTVVFAIVIAFVLHLDASRLLTQIRSDPGLRAQLAASADSITRQANLVLGTSVPSVYRIASQRLSAEAPELRGSGEPPAFVSEADGEAWIAGQLQHAPEQRRGELLERYRALVQGELKILMGRLGEQADTIARNLERAGFQLLPNYSEHTRKFDRWPDWWPFTESEGGWNDHFFGVLASAALLSLGAPFWFNALKTATTLRPIVATREKEERAQRA